MRKRIFSIMKDSRLLRNKMIKNTLKFWIFEFFFNFLYDYHIINLKSCNAHT